MAAVPKRKPRLYDLYNEIWSAITHGVGIILATVATTLLVVKAVATGDALRIGAFAGFGLALILLYTASTLFHALYFTKARHVFQVMDHSGVFILIAGSYLPYCLLAIGGRQGIMLLATIWLLCAAGIGMECFFMGRFKKIEVAIYIILGWLCVVAAKPLMAHLGLIGIALLVAGGLCYTIGALLYTQKQIPYIHVIWHLFVMAGSACMFFSIYLFV
ncbi:PAQR family membrane homeostasis protein TrhA [Lacticaseibacillus hulanensis]|uniref:PAQR family membrane homeostasis protein TrhA n=1 Tax=Lacticaseibacillus hulanensis TaxID=2493111 RepID=UPI000FDCC907|nr:hemolysin III family protein [Lacticaseibacillus hulanensis]